MAHESLEATLDTMNRKLDSLMEGQLEYSNRITKLETLVTNGMSHNIIEIKTKMETVCESYGKRLAELESFSWFRKPMNELKDSAVGTLIKVAFAGGVLYMLYHFGDQIVKMVWK